MSKMPGLTRWVVCMGLLFTPLGALAAPKDTAPVLRILLVGDSWSLLMGSGALGPALQDNGLDAIGYWSAPGTVRMGSGVEEWAENRGRAEGALQAVEEQLQQNPTLDVALVHLGFDIIFGRWKAIGDFDPPITPEEYAAWEATVWENMKYGSDGQHGLKLIFDRILAVRPDIKILFSSYDYIGSVESDWDMPTVHKYNVGMERFTAAVIDLINTHYRHPPRAFLVNNLGLAQFTWGYPGPNPETIPATFWPPPGTPHDFRFAPGPFELPGTPPLFPGNEAAGYLPLAGGDPNFRISPYIAQLDPPISGWVHLSTAGYRVEADHCIHEYMAAWFQIPKVYAVRRATMNPLNPSQPFDPIGAEQVVFAVTFSEPVSGPDIVDFEPVMTGEVGGASIEDVSATKDSATYLVTVNTGYGNGTLGLAVLDHDSILDGQGNPLGGTGANNGYFASGETYRIDRNVTLPMCPWPLALAVLMAGSLTAATRRTRAA